ncbi:hypothetical protein BOTCAL_0045g00290 [Botryotinia calthae]|uniref:Uncharacterized protein n=1 Tax=Botryotinia calthae TaxID=38488 RepID=A0A4Y8DBS5_9HELO|nr:hypothetical protein BOTCAL_0045g00290 [Botryotinia calthae]
MPTFARKRARRDFWAVCSDQGRTWPLAAFEIQIWRLSEEVDIVGCSISNLPVAAWVVGSDGLVNWYGGVLVGILNSACDGRGKLGLEYSQCVIVYNAQQDS